VVLAVKSLEPKFRPVTVMDAVPLEGRFFSADETTGASKLNNELCVPLTAWTVSFVPTSVDRTALVLQTAEVAELHIEVEHALPESDAVAESSWKPKLKPLTVTEAP
jgi:hypothetical protein